MKPHTQLVESIQRFRDCFWERRATDRPPVGVYDESIFLPINFLRRPFTRSMVCPEDVSGELVASDYEYSFAPSALSCDDYMAFSAPWRGIPWLEAACGCPVRYSQGSLAPDHFLKSVEDLAQIPSLISNAWFNCMRHETERLESQAEPDCWISPSILRGPSDTLAAMRGMTEFFLDLQDNPNAVEKAARHVNQALMAAIDIHYSIVRPKLGGYGLIFGYWAPGKTFMLQEDALGMCSPLIYRGIFMQCNAEIVRHLGAHVLFHLHSTGYKHYSHVLNIPGIAGLEVTLETVGPTLQDLIPVFREILERSRLILQVGTGFEYLPEAIRKLPREGLFIIIPSKYIPSDEAFRAFVSGNFPR
jgi:hypothetical protein